LVIFGIRNAIRFNFLTKDSLGEKIVLYIISLLIPISFLLVALVFVHKRVVRAFVYVFVCIMVVGTCALFIVNTVRFVGYDYEVNADKMDLIHQKEVEVCFFSFSEKFLIE